MTLTLAQLLGTPAFADARDLDRSIESCKKATGSSTAIAVGRVNFVTNSTGVWAIATAGSTGRFGVVPKLDPVNGDDDPTFANITSAGAEIYVECNGTIERGAEVVADTGGKIKIRTSEDPQAVVGVFRGIYGEGSGLSDGVTDGTAGVAGRIALRGGT